MLVVSNIVLEISKEDTLKPATRRSTLVSIEPEFPLLGVLQVHLEMLVLNLASLRIWRLTSSRCKSHPSHHLHERADSLHYGESNVHVVVRNILR